jgi:hypothetical protein
MAFNPGCAPGPPVDPPAPPDVPVPPAPWPNAGGGFNFTFFTSAVLLNATSVPFAMLFTVPLGVRYSRLHLAGVSVSLGAAAVLVASDWARWAPWRTGRWGRTPSWATLCALPRRR